MSFVFTKITLKKNEIIIAERARWYAVFPTLDTGSNLDEG